MRASFNFSNFGMRQNKPVNKVTNEEELRNSSIKKIITSSIPAKKYLFKIGAERINRLFKILTDKEKIYGEVLKNLNFISFTDLVSFDKNKNISRNNSKTFFNTEIEKYLRVENSQVVATDEFIVYLNAKSDLYSFKKPRNFFKKATITEVNYA